MLTQQVMYLFLRCPGGGVNAVDKCLGSGLGMPAGGSGGALLPRLPAERHPQRG